MGFSFSPVGRPPTPAGGGFWKAVLGESKVTSTESIFEKNRVGFGRTELSLRLSCTEFSALSSGHGPRNLGFQGGSSMWDFYVFFGLLRSR